MTRQGTIERNLHTSLVSPYRVAMAATMTGKVLDCGGGLGIYLDFFNTKDVVVMDICETVLKQLHHDNKVCADGCALPFADNVFDGVWACAVAPYVADLDLLIQELRRVTRQHGRILLIMPNGKSPWDKLKKLFGLETWWDLKGVIKQYSVNDIKKYGKVYGEIRFLPTNKFLRNFPKICHSLFLEIIN